MVVLRPALEREELRVCSKCGSLGLRSPVLERTHFFRRGGGSAYFASACRGCVARETAAWRARRPSTRRSQEEVAAQNERRKTAQMDAMLAAEEAGGPRIVAEEISGSAAIRTGALLPVAPFREWVDRLLAEEERAARVGREPFPRQVALTRLAGALGVSARTLYRYRRELTVVYEGMVDHACSRHGGYHILDLYPGLYDDEAEAA